MDRLHTVDDAARRVVGAARATGVRNDRRTAFDNMLNKLQNVIE
jgi:hypothetical protein